MFTYRNWLGLEVAQWLPVYRLALYRIELIGTYLGSPLENDRLFARASAESECAHSFGGSVLEAIEHLVQTFKAEGFHK